MKDRAYDIDSTAITAKSTTARSSRRSATSGTPLLGRTIALPEGRELERLAVMLEEKGATTLRCPLIDMVDAPAPPVLRWLERLTADELQYVVLLTGEGLRRLLKVAKEGQLYDAVVAALGKVRTVTRGPKPARVLREVGLLPTIAAETPTTDGIMDALRGEDLEGKVVGVQLYGQAANDRLTTFLTRSGASPCVVAPYAYVPASDDGRIAELVGRLAAGEVDVIAITCRAQVEQLFEVASRQSLGDQLAAGLKRTRIAAVGPVAAAAIRRRGYRTAIVPQRSFFLRTLVNEMIASLRRGVG